MLAMNGLLEITLGKALRDRAEKNDDRESFVFPDRGVRWTFGEVDKKTDALAKGLLVAGLKKGDIIGILANNIPEWALVFYAASRLGIVVVPINPGSTIAELGFILNHADIKALFIIDKYRNSEYAEMLYQLIYKLEDLKAGNLASEKFLKFTRNIPAPLDILFLTDTRFYILFGFGIMFSFPWWRKLHIPPNHTLTVALKYTALIILFVWSFGTLATDAYNPFIYFRF
jgi:acyl-coenzyme A synthetase/AMP-(fatty) acid ligase